MERLYTIPEAAEILRVSRQTIYNWHKAGAIAFVRVNGNPRVQESAIREILKTEGARK